MLNVNLISIFIVLSLGALPLAVTESLGCTDFTRNGALVVTYGIYLAYVEFKLSKKNQKVSDDYEHRYIEAKRFNPNQKINSEEEFGEYNRIMIRKSALKNSLTPSQVQSSVDSANRKNTSIVKTREFWVVSVGKLIWGYGDVVCGCFISGRGV